MKYVNLTYRISGGRQAAMSHHYFPFRTSVLHLEISQSLMIIQLLTHYTKSILKSLINQLCDISRCNTQSNLSKISL